MTKTLPKLDTLLVVALLLAIGISEDAYSSGNGISGATLKNLATSCGDCHGSAAKTATVNILGPATLAINQTARCTVTVSGSPNMGCDIAVSAGSLTPVSANLKTLNSELTHNNKANSGPYIFDYTAPGTQQTVTMYASGVSGGFSGTWNTATNRSINVPLPIQISSFTGAMVNAHTVRLEWSTISEINNYGFYVQRRSVNDQSFTELSNVFIPGHGTTTVPQHYTYSDDAVTTGTWYYRLRQVDLDGTPHLTDPVQVNVVTSVAETQPLAFALQQNYPNPFNPATTIGFSMPKSGNVKLQVYNLRGQIVATLVDEERVAGEYSVEWTPRDVASGMYIYRLRAGNFVETKKLVLLK